MTKGTNVLVKLSSLTKTYRAAEVETAALHNVNVEIEGEDKPALIADWIGLIFI